MNNTCGLFSEPSFIEGIARLFDFGGTLNTYNSSKTDDEADKKALYSDWVAVGEDLKKAVSVYEQSK